MTANEIAQAKIIGHVTAQFNSHQFMHIIGKKNIKQKAAIELLRIAKKEYEGNIEIRNIVITGSWSGLQTFSIIGYTAGVAGSAFFFWIPIPAILIPLSGNTQKITATGDVVSINPNAVSNIKRNSTGHSSGIESAMNTAADVIMDSVARKEKLAIVNVSSNDRDLSEFVANELEYLLVNNRFTVVDRSELDRIRREQNFQLSGDVDDKTIVSIGKFAGADIVLTGAITGTGETRRLRLRALNTQTAQVVAVASERF
jgi:hypothetical protein